MYNYNDFTSNYAELREKSGRSTLYAQRQRQVLVEVFRIINGKGPQYLQDLCAVKES